ncbi:MAG: PAS domain S-box protein [Desulfuromusa sp.]|nr:PAS domain S-box protein [Desulfuromusa sp.]
MTLSEVDIYKKTYLQAKTPTCILSPEGTILQVNPAHTKLFYGIKCLSLGDSFASALNNDQLPVLLGRIHKDQHFNQEAELTREDGKLLRVDISASGIRDKNEKIAAIIVVSRDQTTHRERDNQLQHFRTMVDQSNDAFFIIDATTSRIRDVNLRACERWGYSYDEILQLRVIDLNHTYQGIDGWRQRVGDMQKNQSSFFETTHTTKEGKTFPVEISHQYIKDEENDYIIAVVRDISERKKLEHQLRQAQKMESLGTLAGGIAHDFNNILSAILGYAQLAQFHIPQDSKALDSLQQVIIGGQRATELVKQIMAFSRKTDHLMAPIEIQKIIAEALRLLRPAIPTTIEIRQDIDQNCPPILADGTQIHQILMNLCTNAYHAMREQKTGMLEISLNRIDIQPETAIPPFEPLAGGYLQLLVSDTGTGIDKATLEKIFEPYFTTKKTGEGTGLGLAVAHGIIRDFGGYISVDSELGKGTCFKIYLPIPAGHPQIRQDVSTPIVVPVATERLLVVDDEKPIADLIKAMLERYGYQVTTTTESPEALRVFKQNPTLFDMVITDYAMPQINGIDLAAELLKIRADLPILLCTGVNDTGKNAKAQQVGIKICMTKPFQAEQLALTVRKILDRA